MHLIGTLMISLVSSSDARSLLKLEILTMDSPKAFIFFHFIYSESNKKHLHHKPNFNMCLLGDKKNVSTGHCWREKGICVLLLVLASLVKTRSYWCCQMEVFVLACWMRGCCGTGHLVFLPLRIWYKAIEIE